VGKLRLNKKQAVFIGISLIVVIAIIMGITYSKKVKDSEIKEINEFVSTYKDEVENYILEEYEEEYNNLVDDIDTHLKDKDLDKAKNDRSSLEDLKDEVVSKNKDMFNEKNEEINNIDIAGLGDDKKQEINKEKDEIGNLYDENKYKIAIEKIGKLKEYITSNIEELKKQKEDEKKKQEEEEKKKNSEKQEEEHKEQTVKNSPDKDNSNTGGSYVSKLKVAQETNQLVIVKGQGGSDAIVEFHVKDGNGVWTQVFSTSAYVGQAGITYSKRESDRKTPAGVYSFGTGFGVAGNPGTNISYRQLTNNDYWVDDSNSKYYNSWVRGDTPNRDWNSAEHMIDHPNPYKYGIVINYNTYNTIPGNGSAIFLHCKTQPTPGCVAIPENYMVSLLRQINSSARIVISPNEDSIYNF
jgi:L,D-peptidoglycan transpeptidase YkuD (ErfK/YbiS/YcfS/YnhG family)